MLPTSPSPFTHTSHFVGSPAPPGRSARAADILPMALSAAVASQDSGPRGPPKGARGVQGPWASCSRSRGEGRQLPFNKGLFQPSHSLVVPKAQTRKRSRNNNLNPLAFPCCLRRGSCYSCAPARAPSRGARSQRAGGVPASAGAGGCSPPRALLTAGTVRAPGWALGVRGGGLCETRLSEGPVSTGRGGWCPMRLS